MLRAVPELADQTIVLNGVAKTYAMTGWRVGWMISPADVTKAAANFQSHLTSNVANVSQRAAIAALEGGLEDVHLMRKAFDRRRTTMVDDAARRSTGVSVPHAQGRLLRLPVGRGTAWATDDPRQQIIRRAPTSPQSSSKRPRSPWCLARPSAPAASCA